MKAALTTALDVFGALAVAVGVALIYVPAGIVVLGAGCLFASWRLTRR
ncbi:hypothetical protein [Herbiconiux sp. VKM Ac-2851]|nr:hypothetical protein [Herbiconiux sp. VKM Ac-2851]NQX36259.1 hypothetical protein [Herbiconiux sp. VKM Ac-2851]